MRPARAIASLVFLYLLSGPGIVVAAPAHETAPPIFTVILTSGDTLRATQVRPSGIDMVRIDELAGSLYAPANRVRLVLDETGADRTRDALDRRRTLGIPRPGVERAPSKQARPAHYGPLSVTKTFPLTETSGFARLDDRSVRDRSTSFQFDVGRGVNIGTMDAVAMSVFVGVGDGAFDVGVRYRYRRWIGTRSSFDIAPGLILAHEEPGEWEGKGVGFVGQVAFNATRVVSVGAQVFSVGREIPGEVTWSGSYPASHDRDSGVMIGVKLGGAPGAFSAIGGAILTLFLTGHERQVHLR